MHNKILKCKCGGDLFVNSSSVQGRVIEGKNGCHFESEGEKTERYICKKCGMDFYSSSVIELIKKAQSSPEKMEKEILKEIKKFKTISGIPGQEDQKKFLSIVS